MSRIDALCRMLAQQGGTTLALAGGTQPQLFHGKTQLRFFLPPMPGGMLREMVRPLLDGAGRDAFDAGERVLIRHTVSGSGQFEIEASGGEAGAFSGEIRRLDTEPEPKKAAAAAPSGAPTFASLTAVEGLLEQAMAAHASDLHLAEGERPVMRQHGRLRPLPGGEPLQGLELMLGGLLDQDAKGRLVTGASVDLGLDLPGGRVRGNVYRHRGGVAAAFRVIDRAAPALDSLNFSVDLRPLTQISHGLILVCGPTGSGKSTTLAALMRTMLERRGGLLLTLESPIEYTFEAPTGGLVRQRAVGEHARDFASGLRDALREDPDYLLVGEMRDPESIELALTAAETGHVVLSTLHARNSASAIARIADAYPAARQRQVLAQLADSLAAVVVQRLLPRADGAGRVPALEVLRVNHAVAGAIRDGRVEQIAHSLQAGGEAGMRPLARSLAELVLRGQVRFDDAEAAADDVHMLNEYLRR